MTSDREAGGFETNKKIQADSEPLETRHVFLDTEVYRRLKHNVANPALGALMQHVNDHLLSLHITDITLLEIKRQIAEDVGQTSTLLSRAEKDLRRFRHIVPEITKLPDLSATVAEKLFGAVQAFVTKDARGKIHMALAVPAAEVFADYFARRPPFDGGGKEFPDSFALKALDRWCAANSEKMYVVTNDAAMLRYVEDSPHLLPRNSITGLLSAARASSELAPEAERLADELLNSPAFDSHLERAIESHADELILEYYGDLPEGEVTSAGFEGVIHFVSYNIVTVSKTRISLLVDVDAEIAADVAYEDRDLAMYDKEGDQWIGADWESTTVRGTVPLELYVELSLETGEIITSELLRIEYMIS
jgi:PIN domain